MPLTDLQCKNAAATGKEQKIADGKGLYLFVTKVGFKSWRWKYRFAGKEKRLILGSYPDMKLSEARIAREEAARTLRSGADPSIERKQQAAITQVAHERTLEIVAREWHELQKSSWSAHHTKDVLDSLETHVFPEIGALPITAVTSPLVLKVVRKVENRPAVETARRVRQRISAIFIYAIASGYASADPAASISGAMKPLVKGRQPAFTTLKDARALLEAAEAQGAHPSTKLASRFLALTAIRPGVVRVAEWREIIDLDGAEPLWHIPAAKMKLGQERKQGDRFDFLVPLSSQAVDVLKAAAEEFGQHKLLFPSQRHAHRPISENAIGYFYNRLTTFRGRHVPHGWRATFSTVMNERAQELDRPADRAIIDLMLAHIPEGVEAIYNRAAYMPRRRALAQEWADLLLDGFAPASTLTEGPRR